MMGNIETVTITHLPEVSDQGRRTIVSISLDTRDWYKLEKSLYWRRLVKHLDYLGNSNIQIENLAPEG